MTITATPETQYLQIGESKYGKPALDPIAQPALSLDDGARPCLVSPVGTARSNLTVVPPFSSEQGAAMQAGTDPDPGGVPSEQFRG
jgi:predicted proteasome-type protease